MNFSSIQEGLQTALEAMTVVEGLAVFLGLAYIILAAKEIIWCWLAAFISVCLYIYICLNAKLYAETGLQFFYLIMAIYGWLQWRKGKHKKEIRISEWKPSYHIINILLSSLLAFALGYYFDNYTDAANPYIDSFTTAFAISTTYLVTKKILSNWLYWIVVDGVSVYLYFSRELYHTTLLFAAYVIIVIFGYISWRKQYQLEQA